MPATLVHFQYRLRGSCGWFTYRVVCLHEVTQDYIERWQNGGYEIRIISEDRFSELDL